MKANYYFAAALAFSFTYAPWAAWAEVGDAKVEFFEKKIRPIFVSHCYSCHSAETKADGDLRVDDLHGLLSGGRGGPAVVPGQPEKSLLLERVKDGAKKQIPKEGDLLTAEELADLTQWIADGAAWPRERIPASLGKTRAFYTKLKAEHWAWQKRTVPAVPIVQDTAWPSSDLDRFILARLEAEKLPPVADADAVTLLRRVTYDLTGLPPTPEALQAFVADKTPGAFERVVDGLLASPQFGERWGRHWLDVARYGESTGPSRNIPYPSAWKYRNYVIDALNADVPFDRFIQEQIAGDLLPAQDAAQRDRLATATGFLALGVKDVNQRFKTRFLMDNVDEKIDTVSRSVLGLTVSCARCHDHKFDPIPTTDYYALAGIFTSTEDCAGVRNKMGGGGLDYYDNKALLVTAAPIPQAPAEEVTALQKKADEAKAAFEAIRGTPEGLKPAANGRPTQRAYRQKWDRAQADLLAVQDPATRGFAMHGVREGTPADTEVRIRGEAERLGPLVPRGFLTTFQLEHSPAVPPNASGRLELAQWLTSPENPLTARVQVNRIWAHLFGQGIVNTVDNFGVKGDTPSHPELLDFLAQEFIRGGWSVKRLVRTMVLSHAYRLGSDAPALHHEKDPANRLVWRHSPRRLDAEELRDAMLASAAQLKTERPAKEAASGLKMIELRDNGPEAKGIHEAANQSLQRSVYLPLLRGLTPSTLEPFDPATQSLVTGQREVTTVPTQALYLLNSSFVRRQALALAESTLGSVDDDPRDALAGLYLRTLNRFPTEAELDRAQDFLTHYALAFQEHAPVLQTAAAPSTTAAQEKEEPENPDNIDTSNDLPTEEVVQAPNAETAAWMALAQALYGTAEFRYLR